MKRAARRSGFLCAILALCAQGAGSDAWLKITSANFELYTTGSERSARDLIRHFEQVRSFFTQAFGNGLAGAKPARIIAFRGEKEFAPYRPNEFASAFYQPGEFHDFILMTSGGSENYPVAVHEFTHLMVHQSGQRFPAWFNEGLAELFSNLQPMGSKIKVGQDIPARVQTLAREKWIDLRTLLSVDHNSPYYNERSRAGMFYAESWALVHMLYLGAEYRPHLNLLAAAIKEEDPEAMFRKAYNKSVADVESDLRFYLRPDTIKVMVFDIQLPKSVETPQIEGGAALPARLALAELLSNYRGRTAQARTAYEDLAKEYPNRWEVEGGWGQFSWHERKLDDASHHFSRAVELGSQDPQLFLDYGRVLYYTNHLTEAIDVLLKAAKLNPDSDEVQFDLGSVYVRNGNWGAALAALRSVKKVAPEQRYRYLYNLAFAEYRLGQTESARTHAAQARRVTHIPDELAAVDRLDRALEQPPAAPFHVDSGGTGDEEPRRLLRRAPAQETAAPPPAAKVPAVEGTLENMECGQIARLHVKVEGAEQIFLIPNPTAVTIRSGSGSGESVELKCGLQKPPRSLRIEYQAMPESSGAAGLVRSLEFK
jgi:tetratricopeptide (TPR) repeat protein